MTERENRTRFDAIVIGSGIGGLACAAALGRMGHRVLVLEKHFLAGGLTQTFSRDGFTWDVGVHYLGGMGPGDPGRRLLDWLSGHSIDFASVGPVYDIMHFPGGFEFHYARPEEALKCELKGRFSASIPDIEGYFHAVREAAASGQAVFSSRSMPAPLDWLVRLWNRRAIARWWGRSTRAVLEDLVGDPKLRAVLAGQRPDYCPDPRESSFGIHAMVTRHYFDGAYYPIGGAKAFADALVPAIEALGGEVRTRAEVKELLIERKTIAGVRLKSGEELRCPKVLSAAGAHNTLLQMLPRNLRAEPWIKDVASLHPSSCHVQLYLGLEGDIHSSGATASNHWFHESWELGDALWHDPASEAVPPVLFVSFPSLKAAATGSAGDPGKGRHTAEVVAFTTWQTFAPWEHSQVGRRPLEYQELKQRVGAQLLAQFARRFPALAPMVVTREVSTPLTSAAFVGAPQGGVYGLEASPRRFTAQSLRARTPIDGLYLAGQDVGSMGIMGAMIGGVLGAAALEPRILGRLPRT